MTATRTKRILSVQPVAERGGSDHALLRMVRSLADDGWDCHVAVPAPVAAGRRVCRRRRDPARRAHAPADHERGPGRWLGYCWPGRCRCCRLAGLARRRAGRRDPHQLAALAGTGGPRPPLVRRPHVWHAREIVFQSAAALRVERWLARHFATLVVAISAAVAAQLDPANVEVVTDEADPAGSRRAGPGRSGPRAGIADERAAGRRRRPDRHLEGLRRPPRRRRPPSRRPGPAPSWWWPAAPVRDKEAYADGLAPRAGACPGCTGSGPGPTWPS